MKKLFSISFALLIFLSGMHFSIATHICGGEVAAVKWSFSGEKATCGMENPKQTCPARNSIASNCCQNEIVVYAVDNNYNPSSYQIKEVTKNLLQVFYVPVSISLYSFIAENSLSSNTIPPDIALTSAVSLADICIFRI
jgi:hypothetical protein